MLVTVSESLLYHQYRENSGEQCRVMNITFSKSYKGTGTTLTYTAILECKISYYSTGNQVR